MKGKKRRMHSLGLLLSLSCVPPHCSGMDGQRARHTIRAGGIIVSVPLVVPAASPGTQPCDQWAAGTGLREKRGEKTGRRDGKSGERPAWKIYSWVQKFARPRGKSRKEAPSPSPSSNVAAWNWNGLGHKSTQNCPEARSSGLETYLQIKTIEVHSGAVGLQLLGRVTSWSWIQLILKANTALD